MHRFIVWMSVGYLNPEIVDVWVEILPLFGEGLDNHYSLDVDNGWLFLIQRV